MARREIHNELDRKNRNNHNNNYDELYRLKRSVNDLVLNADGDSNPEVVQARAGEDTLNDRLDKIEDESRGLSGDISSLESDVDDKLDNKASLSDLDKYSQETEDSLEEKLKEVEDTIEDVVGNIEFNGVLLAKTSNEKVKSSTTHTLQWDKSIYNTAGFWSSSKKDRIVVPKGVTKVRLAGNVIWERDSSSYRNFIIQKNGQYTPGLPYVRHNGNGTNPTGSASGVVEVTEGDYFQMKVRQSTGSDLSIREDPHTWFSLEVVEYRKK